MKQERLTKLSTKRAKKQRPVNKVVIDSVGFNLS